MAIYIGRVESVEDRYAGGRIKARILGPIEGKKPIQDLPYSFPLLPKLIHVKPKVGEAVLIFTSISGNLHSQRFYLGPIISQPQFMYDDKFLLGATTMLKGALNLPSQSVDNNGEVTGSYAKDDEIALYSRKNCDIILSNDDIRIRCGSRLINPNKTNEISFNRDNPAFIKLKYHENGLSNPSNPQYLVQSTATVVADEINLITNCGDPYIVSNNSDEQITDEEMQKIINKAHSLPYGDVLVDFLMKFLAMFKNHTHKYHNDTPCPDDYSIMFDEAYGYPPSKTANDGSYIKTASGRVFEDVNKTFQGLGDKLLSKHVRIN